MLSREVPKAPLVQRREEDELGTGLLTERTA